MNNVVDINAALNEDIMSMELLTNPKKKADVMSIVSSVMSSTKNKKKQASSSVSESVSELDDDIKSIISSVSNKQSFKKRTKTPSYASSEASSASSASKPTSSETMSEISNLSKVKKMSQADILNMKRELLYQFDRLEKKGVKVPKKFTMASSIDEMRAEYERLKKDREVDVAVQFQRQALMTCVSGMEFLNSRYDPFNIKLDGWSASINDSIINYDEVFEELYEKYKGKGSMAPELKLMMSLAGSAFMFHLTNTMFKSQLPGVDGVRSGGGGGGGGGGGFMSNMFGGLMGSLFGGGGGGGGLFGGGNNNKDTPQYDPSYVQNAAPHRATMHGPDMDNILDDLDIASILKDDRVEVMSTVSESEMSDIHDRGSVRGMFVDNQKRSGGNKRTMRKTMII